MGSAWIGNLYVVVAFFFCIVHWPYVMHISIILLSIVLDIYWITFTLAAMCIIGAQNINEASSIITVVQRMLHTDCVFLVYYPSIQEQHVMVQLEKSLSVKSDLQVASLHFSDEFRRPHFTCRKELYVLLSSLSINQSRSDFLLVKSSRWLLLMLDERELPLQEVLSGIKLPYNCEVMVAHKSSGRITISEVYTSEKLPVLRVFPVAAWEPTVTGFVSYNITHRSTFNGRILRAAVLDTVAVSFKTVVNNTPIEVDGYFGQVWNALETYLDFRTEFLVPEDGAYGVRTPNGSFNGMMGMLLTEEADVIVADLVMTSQRVSAVNFLTPLLEQRTYVYIAGRSLMDTDWTKYVLPFSKWLWIALISSVIIIASCFTILHRLLESKVGSYPGIFDVLGVYCNQGSEFHPRTVPCRIAWLFCYLQSVAIMTVYGGAMTSYLTSRKVALPFTTFAEMLADHTYSLGVPARSAHFSYFKESRNPLMQEIFRKLIHPREEKLPRDFLEGLIKVCQRKRYAFMVPDFIAASLKPCAVVSIPSAFIPQAVAMAIRKGSPYRSTFSVMIQRMISAGILQRIRHRTLDMHLRTEETLPGPFTFSDVAFLFGIVSSGILLSLVVFVLELFVKYIHRNYCSISDHNISTQSRHLVQR